MSETLTKDDLLACALAIRIVINQSSGMGEKTEQAWSALADKCRRVANQ